MQLVPSHVLPLHTEWKRLVVNGPERIQHEPGEVGVRGPHRDAAAGLG